MNLLTNLLHRKVLKVFEVDSFQTVVAENIEQAKEYYLTELGGMEEDFKGVELNPESKIMWFPLEDLPNKFRHPPYKEWDNCLCVEVTFNIAMKYRKEMPPYILAVTS